MNNHLLRNVPIPIPKGKTGTGKQRAVIEKELEKLWREPGMEALVAEKLKPIVTVSHPFNAPARNTGTANMPTPEMQNELALDEEEED